MTNSEIRLRTPKGTLATCEGISGLRPRAPAEFVHLRTDESEALCCICTRPAAVWLDSRDRWERHPARCEGLPPPTNR